MIAQLLMAIVLGGVSLQDHLDGTEIGDANQSISFDSGGKYHAEAESEKKVKTVANGTWAVQGDTLEVKIADCKGPACPTLGKGYKADVTLVAERAMTVRATPPDGPLPSGSYYCHDGGCEKRTGVLLVTHSAKPAVMKYLLDFLIDKNTSRNVTVVWWGRRVAEKVTQTELTWCARDEDRGKKGAELVARDVAELPWIGALTPRASASRDCLYDVQLMVKDDTEAPPAKR